MKPRPTIENFEDYRIDPHDGGTLSDCATRKLFLQAVLKWSEEAELVIANQTDLAEYWHNAFEKDKK